MSNPAWVQRYFILWFEDYKKLFEQSKTDGVSGSPIVMSFARAKNAFFNPKSTMSINLDRPMPIFTSPSPPPSTLDRIENEVKHHLRQSLDRFVQTSAAGNAETSRSIVACICGTVMSLTGLAPLLLQVVDGRGSRSLRMAAVPSFWMGLSTLIAGLNGVCLIMWMFGEGRQLKDYELARPEISSPQAHTTLKPLQYATWIRELDIEAGFDKPLTSSVYSFGTTLDNSSPANLKLPLPPPSLIRTDTAGAVQLYPLDQSDEIRSQFNPSSISRTGTTGDHASLQQSTAATSENGDIIVLDLALAPLSPCTSTIRVPSTITAPSIPHFMDGGPPALTSSPRPSPMRRPKCDRSNLKRGERTRDFPSVPFWAQSALIEDTLILHYNWEVVMRSCLLAAMITAVLIGIMWVLPSVYHPRV